ncbi:hypothetical protein TrRE_jg8566 [Triparma retinervis]|uniref:Small multidrug resistance protein n=1 Tax=Triparma retinervis TaxID=2557542 RepID=A0A9W6Z9X2_9STRA|nr:hypothetical protein TrRE_jg8566 [Triparma retinervis]
METTHLLESNDVRIDEDDKIYILGFEQTVAFSWALLSLAILCEAGGTICMKLSDSFTHFWPSLMIFVTYGISFTLMPICLRRIDLSVTYAVWSGVGTLVTSLAGFCYFGERVTQTKVAAIAVIILGVCMLKFQEGEDEKGAKVEEEEGGRGGGGGGDTF